MAMIGGVAGMCESEKWERGKKVTERKSFFVFPLSPLFPFSNLYRKRSQIEVLVTL